MKTNVIIRMGAGNYDVRVRGADGQLVRFDLRAMTKDQRRNFHREFMNAYQAEQESRVMPQFYTYEWCDDGDYVLLITETPDDIIVHTAWLVPGTQLED
jgi:hypothetical protein